MIGKKGTGKPLNPWKLGYKAGQNVACRVLQAEPGGYAVIIPKDNLPGFLPTEEKLKVGDEVLAQFVCVHNNRILLSARFSGKAQAKTTQRIDWQESMEGAPELSQEEQAFYVYSQGTSPSRLKLKRAVDLIMPPADGAEPKRFEMSEYDLEWLITDLEGGMRTGCVKAANETRRSRSAALLYRGRAVGCIYGSKSLSDQFPTEQSLALMLKDLELPETTVSIYDLPDSVTLSMSALFLGQNVNREDDLDARSYMDYVGGWFHEKKQTACMVISLPSVAGNCLVFVHNGNFCGSFYVDEQKYSNDLNFVYDLLKAEPQAGLAVSILPAEMTSSAVKFGFSLSLARLKRP